MTDLNKERELYESVIEKTQGIKMEHLVGISFNEEKNQYEVTGEKWASELTDACLELNTGWFIWQECVKAKAQAVPESHTHSITLTCAELKEAYDFGAPDESQDQMTDLVTIGWHENGHSGAGYYAYMTECEDEGSIKLGESESGAEG
ncbi:hypothetical protein [Acinetobacter pittii]|uniref:hypothetical protein n=1 Tax=Acinetobacter pittii TaxID=48296 RepID=UPI0011A0F930|nr:hypothetical protein [Acinetobacter pittii]